MQFLRHVESADFLVHDQCGKRILQAILSALKSIFQHLIQVVLAEQNLVAFSLELKTGATPRPFTSAH